ncbi:MAG: glycosyltransferase family 2 protein [Candidatus Bathyarchaeia archaeon]
MKVDVVLLTKNSLKPCLQECVESIFQNVPVNRLIVVDGGSTDGTLELLRKYPEAEIIDDSGGTRATARQKGIAAVETEWHMHVDSDVILSRDWFKKAWVLVDNTVGAIWGVAVPIERHTFNANYAMAKLYRMSVMDLLLKQLRSERCMMHDTLIRTETVKDIMIPKSLHVWEDDYIGRHIIRKGYKFLKVKTAYCLHKVTMYERLDGCLISGYLLKKYQMWTFPKFLSRFVLAFLRAAWIYAVTHDFEASTFMFKCYTLMLKGWFMK